MTQNETLKCHISLYSICAILFFHSVTAHCLNPGCSGNSLKNYRAIVHKVALIGSEDRKTTSEYAATKNRSLSEIEALTSGTGVLSCGDFGGGTGNIVATQSVIVTAAHLFFNEDCSLKPVKACSMFMFDKGNFTELQIDLKTLKTGGCPSQTNDNDWAVLKLYKSAPKKFRHYRLPDKKYSSKNTATAFTQVAAFSDDFTPEGALTKNLVDCSSSQTNPSTKENQTRQLVNDCDSGRGSSGSAIFLESELGNTITAITAGGSEGAQFNWATLIEGDFLSAIKSAAK